MTVVLIVGLVLGLSVRPAVADGSTWDAVAAAEANSWQSVAFGDGVWVAVAVSGADRVMRSTDGGVSWEAAGTSGLFSEWLSVAYGDGVWVAVASFGTNRVMRSTDGGRTWSTAGITGVPSNAWYSVAYGNGVWVAVSINGTDRVMRSTDGGQTWSTAGITGVPSDPDFGVPSNAWNSVAYGDGVWVAVSNMGLGAASRVMRSVDGGSTWTTVAEAEANRWWSVAYGDGVWVAVSLDGTNRVMRSTDAGLTWQAIAAAEANSWESVAFGDGVWVAIAADGTDRVMRSVDDGSTWTSVAAPEANSWRSVAYGDGVWVGVAESGTNRVMRSVAAVPQAGPQASPPAVSCGPLPPVVGATVTCLVTGGDPGIDILWRAAYNPVLAEAGMTLGADGTGSFSFVVPAAAVGQELTVELVEWVAPVSLGVVGRPVPGSVNAGEGPEGAVVLRPVALLALAGLVLLRRRGSLTR